MYEYEYKKASTSTHPCFADWFKRYVSDQTLYRMSLDLSRPQEKHLISLIVEQMLVVLFG